MEISIDTLGDIRQIVIAGLARQLSRRDSESLKNLMKTTKQEKRIIRELQTIVHSQNLYLSVAGGNNRRVINPHKAENGSIVLEDLHTGENHQLVGNRFFNGYGSEVTIGGAR